MSTSRPVRHTRADLARVAEIAMAERGLAPAFPLEALAEAAAMRAPDGGAGVRDLRRLPWCSVDNDDSRDLDQLQVAGASAPDGSVELLVAIADVATLVAPGTALDAHAGLNTTSVYTAARIFPMLPERLSTDLTSLNPDEDRLALVARYVVSPDGGVTGAQLFRALVRNQAKLAYGAVGAWLEGRGALPPAAARVAGLDDQLRTQDRAAGWLRAARQARGALELRTLEPRAVFDGDSVVELRVEETNRAKSLIEELMIAANGVVARFLADAGRPSLRRAVRAPDRWARIVDVAAQLGETLPAEPSAPALEAFLCRRKAADPLRFPDLSLVVVKLLGRGEYVAELPDAAPSGHFGLALRDYTHSTAPNRRYPDLVTQRLVFAALAGAPSPYDGDALAVIAARCSAQESAAARVERQVRKAAAALLLEGRVGERFDGVVTGASPKGTYVRVFAPPVEGRVVRGEAGLGVGDAVRVTLLATDFERGYLDFALEGGAARPHRIYQPG